MRDVSVESNGRDYDGVYVPEELLQNVYLVPFRAAVEAGVGSLMSAYMDLNDVRKWEQVALDGRTAQAMGIPRLRHTGNATTDVLLGEVFRFASLWLSTNSSARGLSPPNCIRTF